jgi:hypothetical protein
MLHMLVSINQPIGADPAMQQRIDDKNERAFTEGNQARMLSYAAALGVSDKRKRYAPQSDRALAGTGYCHAMRKAYKAAYAATVAPMERNRY